MHLVFLEAVIKQQKIPKANFMVTFVRTAEIMLITDIVVLNAH